MADTVHVYRSTRLGRALQETIDALLAENAISDAVALDLMQTFDTAVREALHTDVGGQSAMRATLFEYRNVEDVWALIVRDGALTTYEQRHVPTSVASPLCKIIVCSVDHGEHDAENDDDDDASGSAEHDLLAARAAEAIAARKRARTFT